MNKDLRKKWTLSIFETPPPSPLNAKAIFACDDVGFIQSTKRKVYIEST
jgi:hypothetical protein